MRVATPSEPAQAALRLLNWLARENAILLRAQPELPLLYDAGVTYRRETDETWCDFVNLLAQGHEDCDGLASARAGELRARGWRALRKGDEGFELARRHKPASIPAEVLLTTRTAPGQPGLYHCIPDMLAQPPQADRQAREDDGLTQRPRTGG